MARRAARRDANHQEVGDYIREHGWSVLDLASLGNGAPDYAVGRPGYAALIEVKDGEKPPSARKLTEKEQKVKDGWTGPYFVATSGEDALAQLIADWLMLHRGKD